MLAVGAAVLLAGYSLAFWGNRIRTGNKLSLADVVVPGHYQRGPLPAVPAADRTIVGYNPPPGGVGPPSPIYATGPSR